MVGNPVFLVLNGILITGIVQSSSAVSSVMIVLAINGLISFEGSAYLILGMNIGAGISVLLFSVPLSVEAKKVAVANVLFNVVGAVAWFIALTAINAKGDVLSSCLGRGIERQVANFHTVFNASTTLLVLPFVNGFVAVINKLFGIKTKTPSRARGANGKKSAFCTKKGANFIFSGEKSPKRSD